MGWFRMDTDFFSNDEICDLPLVTRYSVIAVIAYIKAFGAAGKAKTTASQIGRTMQIASEHIEAALKTTLFTIEGKSIQVLKWHRFQTDPTSAERQKRHRETVTVSHSESALPALHPSRNADTDTDTDTDKTGQKRERDKKKKATTLPAGLDCPEFRKTWAEWEQFRREKKQTLTPTTARKQLSALRARAPQEAITMLEQSMKNGWTGIFEVKTNGNGQTTTANTRERSGADGPTKAAGVNRFRRGEPEYKGSAKSLLI